MVKQVQRLSWIWKAWRINRGGRWNQCNIIIHTCYGTFIEWLLEDFSFSNLYLQPGADITDYFNYGFSEDTWAAYCNRSYYFGALSSPHFTFNDFSTWRILLSTQHILYLPRQRRLRVNESGAGLTGGSAIVTQVSKQYYLTWLKVLTILESHCWTPDWFHPYSGRLFCWQAPRASSYSEGRKINRYFLPQLIVGNEILVNHAISLGSRTKWDTSDDPWKTNIPKQGE